MVSEKAFLEVLQKSEEIKKLKLKVYFDEAPESAREPFLVLYSISHSQILEIGAASCRMQLDVFHRDRFKAIELADRIVSLLYHRSFRTEEMFISGLSVQRTPLIRLDDGAYKVPLDIRFISKE